MPPYGFVRTKPPPDLDRIDDKVDDKEENFEFLGNG